MDIGLGNLSYLIWVDYFNLVQLVVLMLAMGQTILLHRYQSNSEFVSLFDKASRDPPQPHTRGLSVRSLSFPILVAPVPCCRSSSVSSRSYSTPRLSLA